MKTALLTFIARPGLLLIAALGGVVLNLKYQWERTLLPRGLMIGHAVTAVIGFALVFFVAWNGP